MKITLETPNGFFSVETADWVRTCGEVIDHLVTPLLLAAGFSEEEITGAADEIENGETRPPPGSVC